MLYKMDDTTFGGDIPSLPQWTGAPRGVVHVQAMLYASFTASLFSAFLAVLGKQWLNRYESTDVRGTGIERSQNRQRKLGGIVTWYFDHVMESLPVMLQVALLLLGCALSLYLWEIEVTVACVVLSVTALGVIFYAFIVVAGTAYTNCPYQTPVARILRHILYHILPHILYRILPHIFYHILRHILLPIIGLLRSALHDLVHESECLILFSSEQWYGRRHWRRNISLLFVRIRYFPLFLAHDARKLAWVMVRALTALARRIPSWVRSAHLPLPRRTNRQVATLDLQCISWILQTSLEKAIRLSTLGFLATTPTVVGSTPLLVPKCFDIFIDCVKVNERNAVIMQGMEQLAEVSVTCFVLTFSHLSVMDPTSSILADIRQHYRRIFPLHLDFSGFPFLHTLGPIHEAMYPRQISVPIEWRGYKPTYHVAVARALSKLSWSESESEGIRQLMPPLRLSFAHRYLCKDPPPSPSVIADCLLIVVIHMGWNVPKTMVSGERYVHTWRISKTLLINSQCTT